MPYVIVSTVALFANLYRNAPLIVGDKDSDPDLMRYLGARLSTSYPVCGSQPMYVMHAPPRSVFDNLEKRGYCLMAAQTIQEHAVWVLARPRVAEDDKTEIQRGGPNDKAIQTNAEEIDAQNSGKSSKETETDKKNGSTDSSKKDKSESGVKEKKVTTNLISKVDRSVQSSVDLSTSKGDHKQIKSILKKDISETKQKIERSELSSELSLTKSADNIIGAGKEVIAREMLLDGCTQTGYGDILRPPYITNLPKVNVSERPSSPPWKTNSFTSLTHLVTQFQEEPNIPKPCGVTVPRLLEENPIFADIPDRTHLGCLTKCEGCCCEE